VMIVLSLRLFLGVLVVSGNGLIAWIPSAFWFPRIFVWNGYQLRPRVGMGKGGFQVLFAITHISVSDIKKGRRELRCIDGVTNGDAENTALLTDLMSDLPSNIINVIVFRLLS